MTETINQRCARLCKEWETAVAGVQAGKLNSQVAGEAYDRYAAAMAERSAAQSGDTASAPAAASATPTSSTAEIAARRRAETSALWKKVTRQVNEERGLGREPDAPPSASHGAPPANSQKSATKSIWSKAIAAANAGIAGGEPSASPASRPQSGSNFLSKAMTTADKQLKDAGFAVVR